MKTANLLTVVLIAMVVGFFLHPLIRPCKENEVILSDTIYIDKIIRDTIYQNVPVVRVEKVIEYDSIYTTIFQPIKIPVDTAAIIAEFNTIRSFSDTLLYNDSIYVHLKEKVAYNRLFDRQLYYEVYTKDKIITNTVYRNGFYYGGSLSLRMNFEFNLGYQHNKNIYILGANNKDISFCFLRAF